ncbi:MAG: hydroxyethylthiazole kinase [Eggerthellaceae bacterium]|jgi:hydroxyethylthiazole kinase
MAQKTEIQERIRQAVKAVKRDNPMAGSITNNVTIDFVANAQLAVGGSAAMVYLPDEAEALVAGGNAVYANVGTLVPVLGESIPALARAAHEAGKALVLDPVALGIGALRTQIVSQLKQYKPAVIRGNASEIIAVANLWDLTGAADEASRVRGVDSTDTVDAAEDAAVAIARFTGGAVAVSGETDMVTDGAVIAHSHGGSELMTCVTGSGCSLGGVMAVYATEADPFTAALTGVQVYNLAGARAARKADAPGSFKVAFIDELYRATPDDIADNPFEVQEVAR